MKLTIIPLRQFSAQDRIDLQKIWPQADIEKLERQLDDTHRLYAARFNERLLGALRMELSGTQGKLYDLTVREVTRRRGVGQYLLEDALAQNPSITHWWVADDGSAAQEVIAAFMQACGFRAQADGWVYQSEV
ncbi:aspartate 1-decarboxylase autocleavage activator [Paramixta manurensis]|uniref:PanD regulatory factor n=1 Tax=Paramixta manurensis TaxID=2740817 RepID=A0A6M8U6R6_9GAMM|nr:aspartate 1-decarboxylase autocleavage activator [Erwiniaceae bacterium PD-1]